MAREKTAPLDGLELTQEVIFSTDAASRQIQRRQNGRDLANAVLGGTLEWVNTDQGPAVLNLETGELVEDRAAAFAALLAFAADDSNHVAGILDDGHGGTFHAGAALWKSSLRLDPNWMEAMRRRSRHQAKRAMKRMLEGLTPEEKSARRYGWRQRATLKLLTLTMPHHSGTATLSEVKRLNRALTLLKKRQFWQRAVLGGIKGVEDALDSQGPHVHAHLLILSRYMDRAEILENWRECLDEATWKEYGFGLSEECPVIVDVRAIKRKGSATGEAIGWEDALNETTKYVTKPAEFLKRDKDGHSVPREALLGLCEVRRWPRMFELLGRARALPGAVTGAEYAIAAQAALDLIHRAYLTGEPLKLPKEVGWELVEGWDHEAEGAEKKRKMVVAVLLGRERVKEKHIRPPSWRDLMDCLPLSEWLTVMAERFRRGKQFRIRMILDANPSAYLVGFNGKTYGLEPST